MSFSRVYESFESVVLRYFNVFGPRQSPFSQYAAVVPRFVTAIEAGRPIEIHGDGEQSRDFTYVGNVVDATIRAGEAAGANGEIFNVAGGSRSSGGIYRRVQATSGTPGPTSRSRSACSAMRRRSPWRTVSGARSRISCSYPRGIERNALQAGFFFPRAVSSPDCQFPTAGSSRTRNQSIMSMRGFFRAIANACFM